MHSELDKLHSALKGEADHILYELGFLHRLNRFGSTVVSGSYFLEVMTWRDLDLYLAVDADEMDEAAFFDLGKEIVTCIHPSKMNYRHTYGGQSRPCRRGIIGAATHKFNPTTGRWTCGPSPRKKPRENSRSCMTSKPI